MQCTRKCQKRRSTWNWIFKDLLFFCLEFTHTNRIEEPMISQMKNLIMKFLKLKAPGLWEYNVLKCKYLQFWWSDFLQTFCELSLWYYIQIFLLEKGLFFLTSTYFFTILSHHNTVTINVFVHWWNITFKWFLLYVITVTINFFIFSFIFYIIF